MVNLGQKGITQIVILIILLLGIIAGVYLVQRTQIFKPKASEEMPSIVQIVDKDGKPIAETIDPEVYIKISLPPGWIINKKEVPQDRCPVTIEDKGTNITLGYVTYDRCVDDQGGGNTVDANGVLCSDPSATKFRCYYSSNEQCVSGTKDEPFNYSCPTKTTETRLLSSEMGKKLYTLSITNNDGLFEQVKGGSDSVFATTDFYKYLYTVIPWKLNELKTNQARADRTADVKFEDLQGNKVFGKATVKLVGDMPKGENTGVVIVPSSKKHTVKSPVSAQNIQTHTINVVIDERAPDVESLMRDLNDIISTVNSKLEESKTIRRVKLGKIDTTEFGGCVASSFQIRSWKGGDIRLVYSTYNPAAHFGGAAYITEGTVCINNNAYSKEFVQGALLHELGHLFGLPDYYLEQVSYTQNEVRDSITNLPVNIGIGNEIQDVMQHSSNFSLDPISVEMINRTRTLPVGNVIENWKRFTSTDVSLKVTDNKGNPLNEVKVEVFPAVIEYFPQGTTSSVGIKIPNVVSTSGKTDSSGVFYLGGWNDIFIHRNVQSKMPSTSVLLSFTYNNETRYWTLTTTDLNIDYFANDAKGEDIITLNFDSLIKASKRPTVIQSVNQALEEQPMSEEEKKQQDNHLIEILKDQGMIE